MTTTIREAASIPSAANAASTTRRCESVSTVEPDLEETTSTVRSRSRPSTAATCSGSVESSTSKGRPAVAAMTSGAREEPPMPASTTRVRPSSRSWAARSATSSATARESSKRSIQPRRRAASSWAA